jgi:hypothetical protein
MKLSKQQLIKFHILMGKELGIKYVGDPGLIQRLFKRLFDRVLGKYSYFLPSSIKTVRPMCFKNIIYLPYVPGLAALTAKEQIRIAVHEATHALRIRNYPGSVANWYGEYFTNDHFRGFQEASAIQASSEVNYFLTGETLELDLKDYFLRNPTLALITIDYNRQTKQLKERGREGALHIAAITAIKILKGM